MKRERSVSEKARRRRRAGLRAWGGIALLFFCLSGIFWEAVPGEAASATITLETKNNKVQVGDVVYVVITVQSTQAIKGFEGYFTYDHSYLQFRTGGGVVHGNDDAFRILDMERSSGAKKLRYSVKFTARKAGGTSISLRKPYNVLQDDGNNTRMSVSYNLLNMMIEAPSKKAAGNQGKKTAAPKTSQKPEESGNAAGKSGESGKEGAAGHSAAPGGKQQKDIPGSAKLRSLEIQGTQLTPAFSPDIEKYSGVISTSKEKLPLVYQVEDSGAKVKITGNKKIKDGKNVIKVTVRGSTGRKTTYRLSMTVQKITPEEDSENSRVDVVKKSGKLYVVGTTTIYAGEAQEEQIPEGFEKISLEVGGQNIICYAPEGDREADYVLIYGEEEQAFYLYDRESGALQSYEKVKMWYQSSGEEELSNSAVLEQKVESYQYMLAIMGIFCALMLLLMCYFAVHSRR